jgi:hypothetical protein
MAIENRLSRVRQRGPSPRTSLMVAAVALVSIIGFALLGGALVGPTPRPSQSAMLGTPLLPTSPLAAAANPTPLPCVAPRIVRLSGPITRHLHELSPTGFQTLTPWEGADWNLVADTRAGFWASSFGRLTRLDAAGTVTASWTFADDALFDATGVVPARDGGVWLWGGHTVAWFDGVLFRDVVPAPIQVSASSWINDVAEAPDGSLWAATSYDGPTNTEGRVFHWDGRSWSDVCDLPTDGISRLAIDPHGGVWVAPTAGTGDVYYFDGATWSVPPSDPTWLHDPARGGGISGFVAADDGTVWMAAGGLGHFDGRSWKSVRAEGFDLSATVSLAVASDDTVWAVTGSASPPGDPSARYFGVDIAHFDGLWGLYDTTNGLPAPQPPSYATITAVAASGNAVVAATRDGFYRLSGGRWVRTGPAPAAAPAAAPAWGDTLLAVSSGEAWEASSGGDGLWHLSNGSWTNVPVAPWQPPLMVFDVARSPDGTLAVATAKGAAVLRVGQWTVLETGAVQKVTFARGGEIWVARHDGGSEETTVDSFRFDGRAWVQTELPSLTRGVPTRLIVARDGEPWLLTGGLVSSLDHFDGAAWVHGLPPGPLKNTTDVAVAANGYLWALGPDDQSGWTIARYGGVTWTAYQVPDSLAGSGSGWAPGGLAIAPDGNLWLATTDRGLARFDGQNWSLRFSGSGFSELSFAPDGTLWVVGPSGVQRLPARQLR